MHWSKVDCLLLECFIYSEHSASGTEDKFCDRATLDFRLSESGDEAIWDDYRRSIPERYGTYVLYLIRRYTTNLLIAADMNIGTERIHLPFKYSARAHVVHY